MKKLILFTFILLSKQFTYSQTFEKILTEPDYYVCYDFTIANNDDVALFTSSIDMWDPNQPRETKIVLLDKFGTIKRQKILSPQRDFFIGLDSAYNELLITGSLFEKDTFLLSATVRIDTPRVYATLTFSLDTNFNILNFNIQDTLVDIKPHFYRIKKRANIIKAIGANNHYFGAYREGVMATIDDSLQSDTKDLFDTPDSLYLKGTLDFLMDRNKNTYLFSEGKYNLVNGSEVQFIKMDSNDQVLQRAFISYPLSQLDAHILSSGVSLNAFWKTDSTFILSATGRTEFHPNRKGDIHLFEYNTDFVRLNYHRIVTPDTSEYNMGSAKTGAYDSLTDSYYIGATKRFRTWNAGIYTAGDTSDFQLVKFDKNLNIIFKRYYRRYSSLILTTLQTDSEGNVIMVGTTQPVNFTDPLDADIFILKVDSLGNVNHPVGVEETSDEIDPINFRFFPNPSSGLVNFRQYNIVENYEMELYNSTGQLMQRFSLQDSDNAIDLSAFPKGIYIYQLRDSKGRRASGKLVRE